MGWRPFTSPSQVADSPRPSFLPTSGCHCSVPISLLITNFSSMLPTASSSMCHPTHQHHFSLQQQWKISPLSPCLQSSSTFKRNTLRYSILNFVSFPMFLPNMESIIISRRLLRPSTSRNVYYFFLYYFLCVLHFSPTYVILLIRSLYLYMYRLILWNKIN